MTANPTTVSHRETKRFELARRAHRIREHILAMCSGPEGAHLGGAMSIADLLAVLYFEVLRVDPARPEAPERDILILSKGHGAPALYAALAERGFFPIEHLATFGSASSPLMAHPTRSVPGVEMPTGSLGHGLSLAVGFAIAARADGWARRVHCILGDGELQEGSVWEAAMAASSLNLANLVAIVDRNGFQITGRTENIVRLEPLAERWTSFGWNVIEIDGHDLDAISSALAASHATKPMLVLAHTVKGKGIEFVEGRMKSHFARLGERQLNLAREALARVAPMEGC